MSRTIEFKNFERVGDWISLDLYTEERFIVKLTDNIANIINSENTDTGLYEYFRKAVLMYIQQNEQTESYIINMTNHIIH